MKNTPPQKMSQEYTKDKTIIATADVRAIKQSLYDWVHKHNTMVALVEIIYPQITPLIIT